MNKIKKYLIGFAVLISVLILLPFLIPVETYLRQAETITVEKTNIPVTIGGGHVAFLPTPRLILNDISAGKKQEALIKQLEVVPTISSLLSETKVFKVKIDEPVIKKAALDLIPLLTAQEDEETSSTKVNIQSIKISDLQLVWPDAKLPVLDIEAQLKTDNALESAVIESESGDLQLKVTPEGGKQAIKIALKRWTSPLGLAVLIDQGVVEGYLQDNKLELTKIDAQLYQGNLSGYAMLTWGKQWKLSGKVNVAHLAVKEPSRMVSPKVYLQGSLDGNGGFSSTAKSAGVLADHFQANFKFKVNDGVMQGLDLLEVASLLIKQGDQGGATEFDEFSGLLAMNGKQYHLRNLKVSSGLLTAEGQVKVKPSKELDGEVEVEIKNSASMAAIPLNVSGTVSDPVVLPSKSAVAGAVAGTAILGPGVGTTLGMKAGSAASKIKDLFGGDE